MICSFRNPRGGQSGHATNLSGGEERCHSLTQATGPTHVGPVKMISLLSRWWGQRHASSRAKAGAVVKSMAWNSTRSASGEQQAESVGNGRNVNAR